MNLSVEHCSRFMLFDLLGKYMESVICFVSDGSYNTSRTDIKSENQTALAFYSTHVNPSRRALTCANADSRSPLLSIITSEFSLKSASLS